MTIVNEVRELLDLLDDCEELPVECLLADGSVREIRSVSEEDGPNGRVILLNLVEDGDKQPGFSVQELYDELCNHQGDLPILIAMKDGGRARFYEPDTEEESTITLEVE